MRPPRPSAHRRSRPAPRSHTSPPVDLPRRPGGRRGRRAGQGARSCSSGRTPLPGATAAELDPPRSRPDRRHGRDKHRQRRLLNQLTAFAADSAPCERRDRYATAVNLSASTFAANSVGDCLCRFRHLVPRWSCGRPGGRAPRARRSCWCRRCSAGQRRGRAEAARSIPGRHRRRHLRRERIVRQQILALA